MTWGGYSTFAEMGSAINNVLSKNEQFVLIFIRPYSHIHIKTLMNLHIKIRHATLMSSWNKEFLDKTNH